jgi:hypothetical protein
MCNIHGCQWSCSHKSLHCHPCILGESKLVTSIWQIQQCDINMWNKTNGMHWPRPKNVFAIPRKSEIYILMFDKMEETYNFMMGIWICSMFFLLLFNVESNNISITLKLSSRFHIHMLFANFLLQYSSNSIMSTLPMA